MPTELIYMQNAELLELPVKVVEVVGKTILVLEQTIFYPQGGGQSFDQGMIIGPHGEFRVDEVRNIEGVVQHIGLLVSGEILVGENVVCKVNAERRALHSRIHAAGHVLDMAVERVGYGWTPGKGYHFPDGPYVEYSGDFSELDLEKVRRDIEQECVGLVAEDLPVRVEFMDRAAMEKVLSHVPEYLPTNRPSRVVFMGERGIPCGGTHVGHLGQIGDIGIRKLKIKDGNLRVSYEVFDK